MYLSIKEYHKSTIYCVNKLLRLATSIVIRVTSEEINLTFAANDDIWSNFVGRISVT